MPRPARRAVAAALVASVAAWAAPRAGLAQAPRAAPAAAAPAPADDWSACRRAIAAVEPGSGLPPGVLLAIALVETGRRDPATGRAEPWPWSLNVEGEGRVHAGRAAAVADVAALQAQGRRSIDVGCMQVNLLHHPHAFRGPEHGFEPEANVRYAAAFLRDLFARTGDWQRAIAGYHSGEAERGLLYQRRVALARIGAGLAAGGVVPITAPAARDLCAPGFLPVLLVEAAGLPGRRAAPPGARRPPMAGAAPGLRTRMACRRIGRS